MAKKRETVMELNAKKVKAVIEAGFPVCLGWRWSESRARDTYGYNICTCYIDGIKVGRAIGGGYDMKGSSFDQFLNNAFAEELKELDAREEYYGLRQYHGKVNGACGLSCMLNIFKAMGYDYNFHRNSRCEEEYMLMKEGS